MSGNSRNDRQRSLIADTAERDLIGACLCSEIVFWDYCDRLMPEHFGVPRHFKIWRAMQKLMMDGKQPSRRMIPAYIDGDSDDSVELVAYLNVLANDAPLPSTVPDSVDLILSMATRRNIVEQADKVRMLALSSDVTVAADDLVDKAVQMIASAAGNSNGEDRARPIGDWAHTLYLRLADALRDTDVNPLGYGSGLKAVDEVWGLLQPEKVYVLAGLPAGGKSALLRQITVGAAMQELSRASFENRPPRWIHSTSLEMSGQESAARQLSELMGMASSKIEGGDINAQELAIIENHVQMTLRRIPIVIDEKPRQSINDVRSRFMQTKRRRGLFMGVVDHLLLVGGSGRRYDLNERVSEAVIETKMIAKEFQIPMILLAQLKTSTVMERPSGKPTTADLYGGSVIEQNADVVAFLHRPEVVLRLQEPDEKIVSKHSDWLTKMEIAKGKSEFYSGKRRGGQPAISRPMTFDGPTMTFYDV